MPSISLPTAALIGGGLTAVGSIASAGIAGGAAKSAAQTQATAATAAEQQQLGLYNETAANVQPFITAGQGAIPQLQSYATAGQGALTEEQNLLGLTGPGGTPPAGGPDQAAIQATLSQTPGYQFTLDQGLKATQNSYAAQGLGSSGAALKGAATFATGLADQTYEQRLQDYLNLANTGGSAAAGLVSSGANAGIALGGQGVQTGQAAGGFGTSGAAATAAGTVGAANALTSGITGLTNAAGSTALLTALNGNGLFGNNSTNPLGLGGSSGGGLSDSGKSPISGTALSPTS